MRYITHRIATRRVCETASGSFGLVLTACCLFAGSAAAADDTYPQAARVPHCVITLAEQADLAPHEAGVLKEVNAREGQRIDAGQVLLQLDDSKAQQELKVAEAKLAAARIKADDDINIRYAKAAADVAKKDLERNQQSNHDVPGSVPRGKIDELELKCTETTLAIQKATHDRSIADAEAGVAQAEVNATKVMIDLLKVYSPVDGVVVDLRAHKGEAVSPTTPVMHVVRLDKLWVEGQVPAADFARGELENQPVTVEVATPHGRKFAVQGKIVFVKPLTDTGGSYMVRAEVQREKPDDPWPLSPGMQADMLITVRGTDATR
jgi:multidrug resistance efflux pump